MHHVEAARWEIPRKASCLARAVERLDMRNHGTSCAEWRAAVRQSADAMSWYVPCCVYERGNSRASRKKNEQGDDYGIDRTRSGLGPGFASDQNSVRELRGDGLPVRVGLGKRDR